MNVAASPSPNPSPSAPGALRDVCLVSTNTDTQGRLGTHVFDLVLPTLGLAYIGAVLERDGHTVDVIDAAAEGLDFEQTLGRISGRYKVVGFYCHTQNFPMIAAMSKRLKACDSPPHIMIGGPHATALPRQCLIDGEHIDSLVFGEGEDTAAELVARVLDGQSLEGVRGLYYRGEGAIHENPPRGQIEDLDSLPMPAWHLFPMERYHHSYIETDGKRSLHIMGSRGCFSDCNYCHSTKMWGPKVRWHSTERVLAEIDHLNAHYGIEYFQFFDDVFTMDRDRLKVLMPEFNKRGMSDSWSCSTRIDLLNENIIKDLKFGGAHHIAIGIETVNDRLLKVINKHVTKAQTTSVITLCAEHKLPVMGMFIIGLPTETAEECQETLDFVKTHRLKIAVFSFLTVYPGTNFWHLLKDSPDLDRDFSKYNLSQNFTYIEKHRSPEELRGLMRKAYLSFYLKPRVMAGLAKIALRNPRMLPTIGVGFATAFANLAFADRYSPPDIVHS
jgi:anaerobic magnesium-protoporphyrin IX monomethyl ester cyclase